MDPFTVRLIIFTAILIATIYLVSCLFSRQFKKIQPSKALLYVTTVAMIGVVGEIFVDTIYAHFFDTPLWRYNFFPIYDGYTSEYAPVLWGIFGFYLYLMHNHSLEKWTRQRLVKLSIIFGIEALVLESIVDLISKPMLGDYLFYYYPDGLWHISAFQNFPFYFLCGALIAHSVHKFKASPQFFIVLSAWITVVTVFFREN